MEIPIKKFLPIIIKGQTYGVPQHVRVVSCLKILSNKTIFLT